MAIEGLDDALSAITATPEQLSGGGEDATLSRIEALLGGEPAQKTSTTDAEEETEDTVDVDGDEPTDTSDDPEEDADATDDEEEDAEEEDEDEKDDSDDEDEEETLELTEEQIANVLGLDSDGVKLNEEGELLLRTKVDGKVTYVPAADLTASYQMEKAHQSRLQQATEERKAFETLKQEETQKLNSTMTDATALVVAMEQQLSAQTKGIDLDSLRANNPGEYAALQQDIAQRQGQIQNIKQNMRNVLDQQQQEQKKLAEERRNSYITEQTEQLISKLPKWSDPEVAEKEIVAMQDAATEAYGFTKDELSNISDHRIVLALLDAMKGRSTEQVAPSVKKKLKSVPKIVKPGNKKQNSDVKNRKASQQKQARLKSSGSINDAAALLLERM